MYAKQAQLHLNSIATPCGNYCVTSNRRMGTIAQLNRKVFMYINYLIKMKCSTSRRLLGNKSLKIRVIKLDKQGLTHGHKRKNISSSIHRTLYILLTYVTLTNTTKPWSLRIRQILQVLSTV